MTARLRVQTIGIQVGLVVAALAVWLLASDGRVSPVLLPRPLEVFTRIPELLTLPRTWQHLQVTVTEILGAFAISAGAGLLVGFWAGRSAYLNRLLEPVLVWFQTVPIILIYPICVVIFGLGSASKIAFAGIYGFFPVALNAMRGLQHVDDRFLRAAHSMGATPRQVTWHVRLPAARPMVMSGVRLGAVLNMIAVIAGQILASVRGIGYEISSAAQTFRTVDLYAWIFFALVLAVSFNLAVTKAEDKRRVAT